MSRSMNETAWLVCEDPAQLLEFSSRKLSARKKRLIACACCRRIQHLLTEQLSRAVNFGERLADGLAKDRQRSAVSIAVFALYEAARTRFLEMPPWDDRPSHLRRSPRNPPPEAYARAAAYHTVSAVRKTLDVHVDINGCAKEAANAAGYGAVSELNTPNISMAISFEKRELAKQSNLVRHILGNPFHATWSLSPDVVTVRQLAAALYNGNDCWFALSDALEEQGHDKLAEHFRQEKYHPKGCWVLDLLLGKK